MNIRPIHPFPARMAPEIAIAELKNLTAGSLVLDPMMGSGTVLRHAVEFGHRAIGFDLDPLAVLMSQVWSSPVERESVNAITEAMSDVLLGQRDSAVHLPWMDDDSETSDFVDFWFAKKQLTDLRRIAFALNQLSIIATTEQRKALDVHRVALSRIIITKSSGASLAADTSHSRPHRVQEDSAFEVLPAFHRSLRQVIDRVQLVPIKATASTRLGDARVLKGVKGQCADMVLTSPPYLNAIDYMRGHKLALVWLGHSISELRAIRSASIGAEKRCAQPVDQNISRVQKTMVDGSTLEKRQLAMVERYATDLIGMMNQTKRVLKPGGTAILVVGNSCLKSIFVKNSEGVKMAARLSGLEFKNERIRELPNNSRYLPMPKKNDSALGKRMRTESVLTFERLA